VSESGLYSLPMKTKTNTNTQTTTPSVVLTSTAAVVSGFNPGLDPGDRSEPFFAPGFSARARKTAPEAGALLVLFRSSG